MDNLKKRRIILIIAACLLFLFIVAALFIFDVFGLGAKEAYVPGNYPDGVSFAEVDTGDEPSGKARYDAYSSDNDPAHPVLDTKVSLYISNLGGKPGDPRPQDIASEYPQTPAPTATPRPTPNPAPAATINPNGVFPDVKPSIVIPSITQPELYIINPDVAIPSYTGEKYKLEWKYTGGRQVTFNVLFSADGGKTFDTLADNLSDQSYTLTFPDKISKDCVLRVAAMLGGRVYKSVDTSGFVLTDAPEPTPEIIADYVDPQVQYTDMSGLRINSNIAQSVWFKAESRAESAAKLVWQLSKIPFWGTKDSFGTETGIIASGELDPAKSEFSVDLKALCDKLTAPQGADSSGPFLVKGDIYSFYMRVVALDSSGGCIGDPGCGLGFTYGVPDIMADMNSTSFAENSEIAVLGYLPYYWEYKWQRIAPDVLNRDLNSTPDMLMFAGLDGSQEGSQIIQKAVQVELQVATSPYTNATTLGFTKPEGLVYSYLDTAPDIGESLDGYSYMTPWFHGIEYKEFVPSKAELDAMGGIYYYVRALFYVPDREDPSILRPIPSETMTIAYRMTSAKQNAVKTVTVKSNIPFVQFLAYSPVQWQAPDYDEYFEVTRHIEAEEMNFYIKNNDTGDFLLPYKLHIAQYHWTREQYQAKLDEMLPVGASFHYLKSEPGFWDEFFGLLKSIYSAVQNAYASAKNAAVSLVDYVPLIGDDARDYLKKAVRYTIDYGLASIGLPPSLPNLDKLAAGGLDYCFKVAVDEALKAAGVPADSAAAQEITEQVCKQLTDGMTQELANALIAQQQNPFHADFIRLYTEKLYEPAYIDVLLANYSDEDTIEGKLGVGFDKSFAVYSSEVVTVPSLKPGESVVVRIYLNHLRNQYDGYNKYFDEIYYGNSEKPFKLTVWTIFDLPDVAQAAKDQGLKAAPLPAVTEYVYDHGNYEFTRAFVPKDPITDADTSVKASDFSK